MNETKPDTDPFFTDDEIAQIREDWQNWKAVNLDQPRERRTYIYQGPHLPRGFEYRLPPFDASTERVARPLPRWRRWLRFARTWLLVVVALMLWGIAMTALGAWFVTAIAAAWTLVMMGFYLRGMIS